MAQIIVSGGDLYQIATQYLGSPLLWWCIAQQNDLTDPVIYGLQTLTIPDVVLASFPDGLPPQ